MSYKEDCEKYPEGEIGDFYSQNNSCITCGAPEAEAPDLIEHSMKEYGHCYFKKQPSTPDELGRAIKAMEVACVASIRYGGQDEAILKRLYERNLSDLCDHKPAGDYKTIIKNEVRFHYTGRLKDLSRHIAYTLLSKHPWLKSKIVNFDTNTIDFITFTHRWRPFLSGTIYTCHLNDNGTFTIIITLEEDAHLNHIIYAAMHLNEILQQLPGVSHLIWFDTAGNEYPESTEIY
ncbi:hypothetical protein FLA_2012 [Filimonas lacunae]|nr:hypothetical protein FLA_2012 [Filimonas lacunae]